MKKVREGKENRKNGANFFKYVQPQTFSISQHSKTHSRSLIDLDQNTNRYQQSARIPNNKEAHHASLGTPSEQPEKDTVKSQSLKKFLSIFGGTGHLNPSTYRRVSAADEKPSPKTSGRQTFTCNIKNMNVNVTNSRERYHKQTATIPVSRRQKEEEKTFHMNQSKPSSQDLISELKKHISQGKDNENKLKKEIQDLRRQNEMLRMERKKDLKEKQQIQEQSKQRDSILQNKIDRLERNLEHRQKCREHELIIQSLKKVINQQLKKIIQLEKLKVQREEIERLQEKINKNIGIANENSARQKFRLIENNQFLRIKRKEGRNIKIDQGEVNNSETDQSSPMNQYELYSQTIDEVTEQEQKDSTLRIQENQEDSILEQVDRYLQKWRNHSDQ